MDRLWREQAVRGRLQRRGSSTARDRTAVVDLPTPVCAFFLHRTNQPFMPSLPPLLPPHNTFYIIPLTICPQCFACRRPDPPTSHTSIPPICRRLLLCLACLFFLSADETFVLRCCCCCNGFRCRHSC